MPARRPRPPLSSNEVDGWQTAHVATLAEMNCVIAKILSLMADVGFTDREQFGSRLALEEAIVNGIKHGNREDPTKKVHVRFHINSRQATLEIEDEGPGFNPDRVPSPLAPENLERPGGRGVFLMRHYMTTVDFNECGNRVTLSKIRAT